MISHGLLFLSLFLFIIVAYIDRTGERADPSSRRKAIDSALFSSYHRRFAIYFVSALGAPLDIIIYTWWDFWSEPLIFIGLYFFIFFVVSIISLLYARERDRTLSRSGLSG